MRNTLIIAIFISLAMIISSIVLGKAFYDVKLGNRYVTVKGIAERNVNADFALWTLTFAAAGNDPLALQQKIDDDQQKLSQFLLQKGFQQDEIMTTAQRVVDKFANQYAQLTPNEEQMRYIILVDTIVRTPKVDLVDQTSRSMGELVKQGVLFVSTDDFSRETSPRYRFNKLNEIKPEMLSEATKEAKKAAEQFALNSGSKLGKIRNASQGIFSISSPMASQAGYDNSRQQNPDLFIQKEIRVVTTVEYYLEN